MKLPTKITPDRIRESIVQIYFTTDIPYEPLVGYLYSALGAIGYRYTNKPIRRQSGNEGITNEVVGSEIVIVPQYFYFNEQVKIQLHQNGTLIFNCVNEYIGWSNYFSEIKRVLSELKINKIINSFTRLGIRYISEFPNIDVLDKIRFSFELSVLQNKISNGNFRIEWHEDAYKIVTNIGSKLPISSLLAADEKVDFVSLIDIDVIIRDFDISSNAEFFTIIDAAHTKQKSIFFTLLKEEFVQSLNPEYN